MTHLALIASLKSPSPNTITIWIREDSWEEIKPVNHKGNQPWILTGKTDAQTEAPIFGHLMQSLDIQKQRHYFANKGPSSQGYGFSSGHVWMWELDCEEGWVLKNWCFWTVVLEKTLENPMDCKEIQPVHPKGNQSWIFTGMIDAEAETPVLWPSDAKNWLWKRPWCWERLKVGGEGDNRGWDVWMASLTRWT